MQKPVRYPINESFLTFQGEGFNMGRAAYFLRLQGCDLACSFCDSASTWAPGFVPPDVPILTAADIRETLLKDVPYGTLVVITGGEPTLHNLTPLVEEIRGAGLLPCLETAGHHPIPPNGWYWICISPKWKSLARMEEEKARPLRARLAVNLQRASEVKLIIEEPGDIEAGIGCLGPGGLADLGWRGSIWLHPEWSKREDQEVLRAICDAVKADRSRRLRAGWQVHKLYQADQRSGTARPDVPLGGLIR